MLELVFIRLELNDKSFANGTILRSSEKRYGRWKVWGHHRPLPGTGRCSLALWAQDGRTTALLCVCLFISAHPWLGELPRLQPWSLSALGINHSCWVWGLTSLFFNFKWWISWIIQKELFIWYWLPRSWILEVPLREEVTQVGCYCTEKLAENLVLTFLSVREGCIMVYHSRSQRCLGFGCVSLETHVNHC